MSYFLTVYCGNSEYDPHVHVCCDGELLVVTDQNARTCCGDHLYDSTTAVCCYGNAIMIHVSGQTECCGTENLYNPNTEACCDGTVLQGTTECCDSVAKVDVAIVIDSSESVHIDEGNFLLLQIFIANLIAMSDVDSGNVRFAMSVFTHEVFNDFLLNTFTTSAEMISQMETAPIRTGGSNTGGALQNLYSIVFTTGDRPEAQNIAIIFTDGHSDNATYTLEQAMAAKAAGIRIIVIGVGLTDETVLNQIASEPSAENVLLVNHFNGLSSLERVIGSKLVSNCTGNLCHVLHAYIHLMS